MAAFVLAELITPVFMVLLCTRRRKKYPEKQGLLLLDEAGTDGERVLSFSVSGDKEGVVEASQKMEQFCEENDMNPRFSMMLPLAIEELLVVLGEHCLGNNRNRYADVRIMIYRDGVLMRIRCGGKMFDPMEWYRQRT